MKACGCCGVEVIGDGVGVLSLGGVEETRGAVLKGGVDVSSGGVPYPNNPSSWWSPFHFLAAGSSGRVGDGELLGSHVRSS